MADNGAMTGDTRKLLVHGLVFAAFAAFAMGVVLRRPEKARQIEVHETTIEVLSEKPGTGRPAAEGDIACIAYTIRLPDGSIVLQHRNFCFEIGGNAVIDGVDEGVRGMRTTGVRTLNCPPHKHWGRAGYADKIPPVTNLTIEITLKKLTS